MKVGDDVDANNLLATRTDFVPGGTLSPLSASPVTEEVFGGGQRGKQEPSKGLLPVGMDRERLCNDILNTGVMGALIGGFALSNLQAEYDTNSTMDVAIYLMSFIGVHACTCSCVTSALLYRVANALQDDEAVAWAAGHTFLLSLPMWKFGLGCLCYLCAVLLLSFRDLEGVTLWRYFSLGVGIMSMSMTIGVAMLLAKETPKMAVSQ